MTSSNNFGAGHTHIFGHNTNKSKQYEVKKVLNMHGKKCKKACDNAGQHPDENGKKELIIYSNLSKIKVESSLVH